MQLYATGEIRGETVSTSQVSPSSWETPSERRSSIFGSRFAARPRLFLANRPLRICVPIELVRQDFVTGGISDYTELRQEGPRHERVGEQASVPPSLFILEVASRLHRLEVLLRSLDQPSRRVLHRRITGSAAQQQRSADQMILFEEPTVLFMCGTCVRVARRECVRVLDVLVHDIFVVLWSRLLDLTAPLAHHMPDMWSRRTQRSGFDVHHDLQSHSVAPACDVSKLVAEAFRPGNLWRNVDCHQPQTSVVALTSRRVDRVSHHVVPGRRGQLEHGPEVLRFRMRCAQLLKTNTE